MGNKRKAPHMGETQRTDGPAHVKFQFNSETFERLLAAFQGVCSSSEDVIFRNKDVSITVTTKGYLDAAMKFELWEMEKNLKEQVTVHLYPGTTSMMVQGRSGTILGKPPFLCFADVFLGALVAGEGMGMGKRMRKDEEKTTERDLGKQGGEEEYELKVKEKMKEETKKEKLMEQQRLVEDKEQELQEQKLNEEKEREEKDKREERNVQFLQNLVVKNGDEIVELKRMLREEKALTSQLTVENAELRKTICSIEKEQKKVVNGLDEDHGACDKVKNKPLEPGVVRQVKKFKEQHVKGQHHPGKPRNTVVTSKLEGKAAIPLRISGSTTSRKGRGEGEVIYTTRDSVDYRGSGRRDSGTTGKGSLVFTGVKEGEEGVAGVHLNGVGREMEDGHLELGGEIYSQCLSQTQRYM